MASDDLASIDIRSGVNEQGAGFLTVVARAEGGRVLLGQMSPDEAREQARAWMEAAEAAEQDAAVLRVIRKLELPDELAGAIVRELRDSRAGDG